MQPKQCAVSVLVTEVAGERTENTTERVVLAAPERNELVDSMTPTSGLWHQGGVLFNPLSVSAISASNSSSNYINCSQGRPTSY
ncbi:hypothetical protein P691DRAFT_808749 [Macrolepiota fuliginosa MF-IS2]|uniref:Uncharacterized protein n=1 Tax=Macrolepiota fuliginosa MF-IS2 TaxID=1400762 RepID=A0A9P5X2U5_9AGAR|nr:hypothetical protein P691DRAFT_808749 [Macrolepiota fuliginosa MF-IS2]